jgi:hypothetical protein
MRTEIFIALVAAAITLSSCDWLFGKKDRSPAFNIEGAWQLDSIILTKDTSSLTPLILSMAALDSAGKPSLSLHFAKDTLVTTYAAGDKDSIAYKIDAAVNQISFGKDTAQEVVNYKPVHDSAMLLSFKDSTVLFLSRK